MTNHTHPSSFPTDQIFTTTALPGISLRVMLDTEGQPWFVARDVALALGYEKPGNAIQQHCKKVNKIRQVPDSRTLIKMPPVHLLLIPEADVYRLIMRPHFTEAHGNVAPNLEAYEVVSQLIFGQSKIAFTENFLTPNLGDYGVAYHTSEAPGLPPLQGRLPSPQDGRVAIRLLPLAGLLLRRRT